VISLDDAIDAVCRETHLPMATRIFGTKGTEAILVLMAACRTIYRTIDPQTCNGKIVVYCRIDRPVPSQVSEPPDIGRFANSTFANLTIEIQSSGELTVLPSSIDIAELAQVAVVYKWEAGIDMFYAGDEQRQVTRIDQVASSQFAVPTLATIREALRRYSIENVLHSTCYIFERAWRNKTSRLFFRDGNPEDDMRDSLVQYLRNRLAGEFEVEPEHSVDRSHPVDISLRPRFFANKIYLIEIKWLGDSLSGGGKITAHHRDHRAREGARQLIEYIEGQKTSSPSKSIHAYYVVIDGRRKGVQAHKKKISRRDAFHYQAQEIDFRDALVDCPKELDPPYRMFATPGLLEEE
jgi:hypothetical protein